MKSRWPIALAFVVSLVTLAAARDAQAPPSTDWPQWRGPDRNGISKETGLLQTWPAKGPAVVWSMTGLGRGYGSLAIQGDRIFVQGLRGRQSYVDSLDKATGKSVWSKNLGTGGDNDRGPGPRGTPTIDGTRLYVLTETGQLACLNVADGTIIWQRNILRDFGGHNLQWLISESPLIDGDRVVVTPGGRGAGIVALDKMTGKTIWLSKDLTDEAGYSSLVIAEVGGVRAYTTLMASAGVGVRASDGKLMWRYPEAANQTANIATPVVAGNQVFYTSNYGTGGGLVTLTPQNGELRAAKGYFTREMQNHHGGVVLVKGTLYGFNNAILTAIDFATGRMLWRDRSVGKGAVTYADNRLYALSEDNVMGLAEVSPAGYREVGRFSIADQGFPSWAHPVVSGGRLYIRNQSMLTAYNISAR
jgi:outer membrane protein assembly factor BamB